MSPLPFTELPTEILEAIALNLDARSLIAISRTNRLIKQLAADSPLIWRHLCRTQFTTWDSRHNIAAKFCAPLSEVDWRGLFKERVRVEARTRELLDHVVGTQHQRIRCINEIADFGYDAKEALVREMDCPDDAEDVLARRYYARAVLERIQREIAIKWWIQLNDSDNVPLERALGAYDIFALVGEHVDMDIMEDHLNRLSDGLLHAHPHFDELSPRIKASTLANYLREQGYQGVSDASYRALPNSFIGLVLASDDHESLPLISVAIYCAVARRVGLDARPCGFPGHVYTLVYAPQFHDLDGKYKPNSSYELEHIYLDPFRSPDEVDRNSLEQTLRRIGIPQSEFQYFLSSASTREIVLRTARNIMSSVQTTRQAEAGLRGIQWIHTQPDLDNAFYSAIWSMLILGPGPDSPRLPSSNTRRRQYLPYLLEHFQTHFPWDVTLLGQYVIPMFLDQPEGQRLLQFVHSMHQVDAMRKPVLARDEKTINVQFKVGQLFQHKRYGYEGVITGWDVSCDAGEEWIRNMDVDGLPSGRNQAFYHVLVCDKSVRYVAEENIDPVPLETEPSPAILRLAGRHFKRWDNEAHSFVSNILDEYPDN
ncbi:Hemimethylated DNA-binding protein YccV like-domain-containing protein [Phaeosphaeria sp. MPI-PUGE-AT-0046c]|nr:Hemimethylated DNA-binding protein YccV like-domain-containing protein [Phaeosphaeria sp. MPI-PUGE-AT-0046c]